VQALANPSVGLQRIQQRSLEDITADYLTLLLFTSALAGIINFIYNIGKTLYLEIFYAVEIQHLRMLNYLFGRSMSLTLFYLFAGTFLIMLFALVLAPMIKRHKVTDLLKLVLFSATPFLLFGWIPIATVALLLWSAFLLVLGIKNYRTTDRQNSIDQRD